MANGPLPPGTREDVRNSVVHRWVQALLEPTVGQLHGQPARRSEREIADAMEVVLEEALCKNLQMQADVEALGAQCVRLRRLLAESYQLAGRPPAEEAGGAGGLLEGRGRGGGLANPGTDGAGGRGRAVDARLGEHWRAVAGGGYRAAEGDDSGPESD